MSTRKHRPYDSRQRAQAAAANRDLVGLTIFDDKTATAIRPARTQTHMIGVLRKLAETQKAPQSREKGFWTRMKEALGA